MAADIISDIISDIIERDSEVEQLENCNNQNNLSFLCQDKDSIASSINLLAEEMNSDEMLPELNSTLEEEEEENLDDFELKLTSDS